MQHQGDVTQINILGTKIYLAAIIDLYSKEVLAYDIRTSPIMYQSVTYEIAK
ncbi:hypothetical protein FC90_GL001760 [Latilactobacillus graminis DSM 20719]|uniref:Uncharacterized protein n=1 Tax=Latilactobacillus graminis DSM 20719 TaxID=1423752 RepID=A0AA89KWQ3_9LACO|nr:hypothetical protein FC90_GL001760 [Latilactobacillus graminis DSM 20719]